MCGNQCGNLHIPDVPYYDRTPIVPTLPQRSDAAGVIIPTDTESYRRLAAVQRSARFCMCRVGNNPMVRQKKHDMGKTAPYNAGGIFVCGNSRPFLHCFCLSHKIFSALSDLVCFLAYSVIFQNRQESAGNKLSIKPAQLFFGSCTNLKTANRAAPEGLSCLPCSLLLCRKALDMYIFCFPYCTYLFGVVQ